MGFRSNFITESFNGIDIPRWFYEKYPDYSYQSENERGSKTFAVAQLWESKFYADLDTDERILDIQKVLIETDTKDIVLILLHECGGITRVHIFQDKIIATEPSSWEKVMSVSHSYCYGCSDYKPRFHCDFEPRPELAWQCKKCLGHRDEEQHKNHD